MKLSDFYKTLEESFRHYTVKHKRSGKTYKVTAMHKNSALEKARAQHGGTASRYTGTGTSDFEVVEGKSPHKKGTKKYKKHMAAIHAGESFKDDIKTVIKGLKGPGYYSLDKDNPDHATDDDSLELLKKKLNSSEFKPHMMYDPKTGKGVMANKEEDHIRLGKKGYVHDKPVEEIGAPDYNPARGGYTDNMIGEPDDYYDAEERQEAYDAQKWS